MLLTNLTVESTISNLVIEKEMCEKTSMNGRKIDTRNGFFQTKVGNATCRNKQYGTVILATHGRNFGVKNAVSRKSNYQSTAGNWYKYFQKISP